MSAGFKEDDAPAVGNGLYCFLNATRPCGPDCMAFCEPPDGLDYQGRQSSNCILLVNAHRAGKHVAILAQVGGELVKKAKNEVADRVRLSQVPPPVVK